MRKKVIKILLCNQKTDLNLSKAEMKALNNLRKGKTIKILVADKNAGTVVMDTQCILV